MKKILQYFTPFEWALCIVSTLGLIVVYVLSPQKEWLTLVASIIGVFALLYAAKANIVGLFLSMVFSMIYGYLAFKQRLYGELITYCTMTLPSNIVSIVAWFRHRFLNSKTEVAIDNVSKGKTIFTLLSGIPISILFYFVLRELNTQSLEVSTISIYTSWVAVLFSIFRSKYYALGYVANDVVLITLWTIASIHDTSNLCMVLCFVIFLVNDLYAYVNWGKLQKKQQDILSELENEQPNPQMQE